MKLTLNTQTERREVNSGEARQAQYQKGRERMGSFTDLITYVRVGIAALEESSQSIGWHVCGGAVGMAIDRLSELGITKDFEFQLFITPTTCDSADTFGIGMDFMVKNAVDVVIAPPCRNGYDFYPVQAIAIELYPAITRPEGLDEAVHSPLKTAQSRTATGDVRVGSCRDRALYRLDGMSDFGRENRRDDIFILMAWREVDMAVEEVRVEVVDDILHYPSR
ncbi:hypothetical protein ANCCEY_06525 [Ancylostoma ceylanicum]|uniref:Receptor ligand binding region domain-containing protein n=1 Tax=Ancylostoma ceylanicum TaxID=53326 RepID=A0A0D6LRC0_9BILA|nr:hypothetical protein ANCCEY_06525 [Ancylostoma ceylanicum]